MRRANLYQMRAHGLGAALSRTVTNATRGGSGLCYVGDTVQVNITGPPSQPVSFTGNQNGKPISSTPMGMTDAQGNFSWSGTVTAPLIGVISESWSVGGQPAGSTTFTVAAAPTPPASAGPAQGIPPGFPGSLTAPAATTSAGTPAIAATGIMGWLIDPAQGLVPSFGIFAGNFPNWIVLAAAVALYMATRGKRR